ncbi:hypothetical protein SAMN05216511_5160 [Streptomyces sp. KS_16]|nr:hypothetical protein BX261_2051 [Streptomyces sp. 2321.6]SDR51121.1 hypothetical protein SAMN05216511_5160 [Streptomyces sp. KS_16]SEC46298.1 hypothetical protein SAMN05428940_2052 [Streptomyces sp. 2133.1]SNC67646.1 hypothetical protein SAMN06272741_2049 [Streptomyces sp. 2114.4]
MLSAGMFRGITDLSGRLLEIYKMKRDGSYFDQQAFAHLLREDEAAVAEVRNAEREERAAAIRAEEASRNNQYEVDRDWRQAQISIQVKAAQDKFDRDMANAPFSYSPEELRELVRESTNDGSRPALLVAPFFHDELNREGNDDGPHAFRVAIRRAWVNSPWAADVCSMDGTMNRPLRQTDLDVALLQRALGDLPVILIYGDVQAGRRVWPTLTAWNIVSSAELQSVQVNFPPLSLPPGSSDEEIQRSNRLAFEDELGYSTALTVGLLGEWFHLANYGRPPYIHRTLPDNMGLERRAMALGLVAAYEVAIQRGRVEGAHGRIQQAALYRDAQFVNEARSFALNALNTLEGRNSPCVDTSNIRLLFDVLTGVGDPSQVARASSLLESVAHRSTMRSLGW